MVIIFLWSEVQLYLVGKFRRSIIFLTFAVFDKHKNLESLILCILKVRTILLVFAANIIHLVNGVKGLSPWYFGEKKMVPRVAVVWKVVLSYQNL